jgi:hypothetical protein
MKSTVSGKTEAVARHLRYRAEPGDCDACPLAEMRHDETVPTPRPRRRAPAAVVALLLRAEGRR